MVKLQANLPAIAYCLKDNLNSYYEWIILVDPYNYYNFKCAFTLNNYIFKFNKLIMLKINV
jgi:hypothetical protein